MSSYRFPALVGVSVSIVAFTLSARVYQVKERVVRLADRRGRRLERSSGCPADVFAAFIERSVALVGVAVVRIGISGNPDGI